MRPPPRDAGGMERAEPCAAAGLWGRAGEAPGKAARCLRQPRRAGPVAGNAGARRGERGPARREQPGGLAKGARGGGQQARRRAGRAAQP